jgi:predicted metal-dependent phosphoesterase TrpH
MHRSELTGRADLHMHTTVSDGRATVEEVLERICQRGDLDVIAITDHDRLEGSLWAYAHRNQYPFEIIPGVEVTSAEGHVLGLWVTEPVPKNLSLGETAAAIHEQGGIAIVAHPFELIVTRVMIRRYLTDPAVLIQSGIDAVEVINAGAITPGNNWLARRTFGKLGLPLVGNSDSHLPETIGSAVTRFKGKTAADLRESLELGTTAAEGKQWPITTYLKLLPTEIHRRRRKSSAANRRSARQTHP